MRRQFFCPAPVPGPFLYRPHPGPDLALHRPDPATLLSVPLDVVPHHERMALQPPLRHDVFDPEHRLHRSPASAAPRLRPLRRVPIVSYKQVPYLLRTHVRHERWQLGLVNALVEGSDIVLVFRQLGPHAAEDAVAEAGEVGGQRGGGGGGVEGREHEFR